jgi:hypothetical protein
MRTAIWVVLAGMCGAFLAGGFGLDSPSAGTGPATIRINERQLAVTRVDTGVRGTSPGDVEVVRLRLLERGTGKTLGRAELVCTFADGIRSRVCHGTYVLPRGKLVVSGSLLYRRFYELAVVGGTGLYDNARGTVTVTRTHTRPIRDFVVFHLVG